MSGGACRLDAFQSDIRLLTVAWGLSGDASLPGRIQGTWLAVSQPAWTWRCRPASLPLPEFKSLLSHILFEKVWDLHTLTEIFQWLRSSLELRVRCDNDRGISKCVLPGVKDKMTELQVVQLCDCTVCCTSTPLAPRYYSGMQCSRSGILHGKLWYVWALFFLCIHRVRSWEHRSRVDCSYSHPTHPFPSFGFAKLNIKSSVSLFFLSCSLIVMQVFVHPYQKVTWFIECVRTRSLAGYFYVSTSCSLTMQTRQRSIACIRGAVNCFQKLFMSRLSGRFSGERKRQSEMWCYFWGAEKYLRFFLETNPELSLQFFLFHCLWT